MSRLCGEKVDGGICETIIERSQINFTWIIHDFMKHVSLLKSKRMCSLKFQLNDTEWQLNVYPKYIPENRKQAFVSVFLQLLNSSKNQCLIQYALNMQDETGKSVSSFSTTSIFQRGQSLGKYAHTAHSTLKSTPDQFLPNGKLIIKCIVNMYGDNHITRPYDPLYDDDVDSEHSFGMEDEKELNGIREDPECHSVTEDNGEDSEDEGNDNQDEKVGEADDESNINSAAQLQLATHSKAATGRNLKNNHARKRNTVTNNKQ